MLNYAKIIQAVQTKCAISETKVGGKGGGGGWAHWAPPLDPLLTSAVFLPSKP